MDKSTYKGHLFTVEVLIEESSNGLALEKLLHLLNSSPVTDYTVKSGIELGKLIELNAKDNTAAKEIPIPTGSSKKSAGTGAVFGKSAGTTAAAANKGKEPQPGSDNPKMSSPVVEHLEKFKRENTLIRLTVMKGKGIKLNLPCRILNYDADSQNVTVYHVDEKRVYLFKLNEIDDYVIP